MRFSYSPEQTNKIRGMLDIKNSSEVNESIFIVTKMKITLIKVIN